MAALEAWSHRLPAVLTDSCNLPEGFTVGAALQIEPRPENIAASLRELIGMDERTRAAMGGAGHSLVETKFSWPAIAQEMVTVYRWVVGGGAPPACVIRD